MGNIVSISDLLSSYKTKLEQQIALRYGDLPDRADLVNDGKPMAGSTGLRSGRPGDQDSHYRVSESSESPTGCADALGVLEETNRTEFLTHLVEYSNTGNITLGDYAHLVIEKCRGDFHLCRPWLPGGHYFNEFRGNRLWHNTYVCNSQPVISAAERFFSNQEGIDSQACLRQFEARLAGSLDHEKTCLELIGVNSLSSFTTGLLARIQELFSRDLPSQTTTEELLAPLTKALQITQSLRHSPISKLSRELSSDRLQVYESKVLANSYDFVRVPSEKLTDAQLLIVPDRFLDKILYSNLRRASKSGGFYSPFEHKIVLPFLPSEGSAMKWLRAYMHEHAHARGATEYGAHLATETFNCWINNSLVDESALAEEIVDRIFFNYDLFDFFVAAMEFSRWNGHGTNQLLVDLLPGGCQFIDLALRGIAENKNPREMHYRLNLPMACPELLRAIRYYNELKLVPGDLRAIYRGKSGQAHSLRQTVEHACSQAKKQLKISS